MVIQIDSREKPRATKLIIEEFDRQGIKHPTSKLLVGDYMSFDNPRLIVDRKQNLSELCANVCQNHDRFRRELVRAQENEIKLVFLVEHGHGINCLNDVVFWANPRRYKRVRDTNTGKWFEVETKAMTGDVFYKILCTQRERYGCEFLFCEKKDTGRRIIEILSGGSYDSRGN